MKSLSELIEQTKKKLEDAEDQYCFLPTVHSAIKLYETLTNYENALGLLDIILIDENDKPLLNKRKRNGNRRILKNSDHSHV
jgi:hypothetical protein